MKKSYPIMDDKAEKKIRGEANTGRQVIKNVFPPLTPGPAHGQHPETRIAMKITVSL